MKNDLSNNFTVIHKHVSEYFSLKLQLVKLSVLEKITKIAIFLTSVMVMILAATVFFLFAAATFVVWYGAKYQDYFTGLLITMGIIVFLMILFYLLRKYIVESFFIKSFSSILFEKEENQE